MNDKSDILGQALLDFQYDKLQGELTISGEDLEDEIMDVSYYFRAYDEMPEYEKIALSNCIGDVLDVGAGAGSHSLYLKGNGFNVRSIDLSEGAVEVMKTRGLKDAQCIDLNSLSDSSFDCLLLLMNGIGISAELNSLENFIQKLLSLLKPEGQIIFDSTDLRYLYMEEDGSFWMDLNARYYGEMKYRYSYNNRKGEWFQWLYIDEERMGEIAEKMNLKMEVLHRSDQFHYLASLSRI